VNLVFPDAGVCLAGTPEPKFHRSFNAIQIVQTIRKLELERTPVAHIHDVVDPREGIAFEDSPKQCFGRGASSGGIESRAPIHGAHEPALFRPVFANRALRLGQRRIEPWLAFDDPEIVERKHAGRNDGPQVGRDRQTHG
jgi:hypothetical protein